MNSSIYSIAIESTAGIARHYFISSDGTFENSIGWGPLGIEYQGKEAELTVEQEQRACEYLHKFGKYNIHTNNCEMFAWYVITGRHYSRQTQEKIHTAIGAKIVSLVQPVLTPREIVNYQYEKAIVRKFNEDLEKVKLTRLKSEQAMRDDFWQKRDAKEN
ncbi:MAG: NC domain-containing protein [Okeania sp. SIO2C2]|uniref:NC domain-containing protein n=1 Tax=Okeania sp. SIO2C2 TaxID=2607787 RepID=UPI0013B9D8DA|nr:NC domain-containing protein [Okeania sp. SIO2C2]NEP89416.1 NC domain-containing protein [Okeania sp. SIO2C2]